MVLKKLFWFSALAGSICAATITEIIDGHAFVHWGPCREGKVVEYELPTYKYALKLLKARMGCDFKTDMGCDYGDEHNTRPPKNLPRLKKKLSALKAKLGADRMEELLQPDIELANAFWHNIIDTSTPDGPPVPAEAHGIAFLPSLNASIFAAWSQSPLADEVNNDVNAEHYFKRTVQNDDGTLAAEILEGWGGVTTLFTIPNYGNPDALGYDFLRAPPKFPIQRAGDKVLSDGTGEIIGVLHISMRDVDGEKWGLKGNKGVEVFSTVWYGDACTDEFLEAQRQHMVIEIVRLTLAAQKDVEAGRFPPVQAG